MFLSLTVTDSNTLVQRRIKKKIEEQAPCVAPVTTADPEISSQSPVVQQCVRDAQEAESEHEAEKLTNNLVNEDPKYEDKETVAEDFEDNHITELVTTEKLERTPKMKIKPIKKDNTVIREKSHIGVPTAKSSRQFIPLERYTTELRMAVLEPIDKTPKRLEYRPKTDDSTVEQTRIWQLRNRLATRSYTNVTYANSRGRKGQGYIKLPKTEPNKNNWMGSRAHTDLKMNRLKGSDPANVIWSYNSTGKLLQYFSMSCCTIVMY